jgi:tetratricopeptide (TPR) repeat protein
MLQIEPGVWNHAATQERAFTVIGTIYDAAARHVLPIDIIESVINIPSYLNEKKASLYTYYIAHAYSALDRHVEAIRSYEEAIRIKPDFAEAWYNKGISLRTVGEQKDADQCFAKARELGLKP